MTYHPLILMDTGVIVAYYSAADKYHAQALKFFERCTSQLITTVTCVTEAMYLLAADSRVQNEFLLQVSRGVFNCEHLTVQDFTRITELNAQYAELTRRFCRLGFSCYFRAIEHRSDHLKRVFMPS